MSESKDKTKNGGFFQRLLDGFFKNNDPELEKKRIMKLIAKELSKTKYKFYKYNTDEVLPAFAKPSLPSTRQYLQEECIFRPT